MVVVVGVVAVNDDETVKTRPRNPANPVSATAAKLMAAVNVIGT